MRASTRCACSRAGARNLLARQASSPRIQLDTTARRSCRGTSPRASERPRGPVPPLGAASCGLGCVYTPTAPCTPLPPMWEVGRARHRVPPPHARSWPSSPPSHWHPRHARARGLAAAARLGRSDPGSPRSVPPRCLQRMPWHARGAIAAASSACHGTRAAQPCATTTNRAGGWENINGSAKSNR